MNKHFILLAIMLFLIDNSIAQNELLNEKNRDYDQLHISLDLALDIPRGMVSGKAVYRLVPLSDNFRRIRLHTRSTEVHRVILKDKTPDYRIESGTLLIDLPTIYSSKDTIEFQIEYSSKPERGIYFFSPDEKYPSKPLQAWTQGQGENNRHWYPAYDLPDDKLTTELKIKVPKELKVIGIGELVSIENKGEFSTYYWKMDKPHSNYLNSFIAGEFSTKKEKFMDVSIEYNVPKKYFNTLEYYFGKTPKMIGFFSGFVVPYPYSRYAQTTVWDFEYGGMENITSTTMNQRMLHDEFAWPNYSAEDLVAHELAHQWFGDYLTCKTWDHIWLNEGFATFFNNLWEEYENDPTHYLWAMNGSQTAAKAESDKDTSTYSDSLITNKIPAELKDGRAYSRGASILHTLRWILGDETFKRGLKNYVMKFAHNSVVTDDFKVTMEKSTGADLTNFFNEWVYSPGYPVFSIENGYNPASGSFDVTVSQKSSHKNGPAFYHIGLPLRIYAGKQIIDTLLQLNGNVNKFSIPVNAAVDLAVYNRFTQLLCSIETNYGFDELVYMLRYEDDVILKAYAIDKLKSFGKDATPELVSAFKREKFYGLKIKLIEALSVIKDDSTSETIIAALNDADARVRESAAMALENVNTNGINTIINEHLECEKNYYVRAALYYSSFVHNKKDLKVRFAKALGEPSHMDVNRRRVFEYALKYKDPLGMDFAPKYLDYNLGTGDNRLGDIAILDYAAAMYDSHKKIVTEIIEIGLGNYYFRTRNYAANLAARLGIEKFKPVIQKLLEEEQRIVVKESLINALKAFEK